MFEQTYPVGGRILVRDEEWRITAVDAVGAAGYRLTCTGLSDLVRGRRAVFFTAYETNVRLLLPEETRLIEDTSPAFRDSKIYLEGLMRNAPKTDPAHIEVAHKAAMDPLPYQFNPALQALAQPRARILIADAVGIGKTLEAGILTSELIARGRGRRILVLAVKSMLSQFQQEFWNRFSIPLVRLDSAGIARVRNRIPTNHNPFLYFDRSIISIDTLKQDLEYRDYLTNAYWDIIIIDEAHNVAQRNSRSQRAKLAQLLADRSDTMIMLTATPHDGRSESFASLLNILDPTAIANPGQYTLADFADKGLVIRRFKKDVREQVSTDFPDREIATVRVEAGPEENRVYEALSTLTFNTLDNTRSTGARLFSTTLTKAMFSSPAACRSVIANRLKKLESAIQKSKGGGKVSDLQNDVDKLLELDRLVACVGVEHFTKLQNLASLLGNGPDSLGWDRHDPHDRLVIFTESIETLRFLSETLPKLIKLKKGEYLTLTGAMSDEEIAQTVAAFNRGDNAVRLLLCSDVASEGINLHHFSHRMIHFDIPWSLMTFQQRNGRIDRYGQTKVPQIRYMQTVADNAKSRGDARVLELLTEKDRRAQENLEDPAEFLMSFEEQEDLTAARIEGHAEEPQSQPDIFSLLSTLDDQVAGADAATRIAPVMTQPQYLEAVQERPALYRGDMDYAREVLGWLTAKGEMRRDATDFPDEHRLLLVPPADLRERLKFLPSEVLPSDDRFDLTDDVQTVQKAMTAARLQGDGWPAQQLLWRQHPVMKWLQDRAIGAFGRHTAPVLRLPDLQRHEHWALLQGGYPNRRGYIPVHRWVAVRQFQGRLEVADLDRLLSTLRLDRKLPNALAGSLSQESREVTDEFSGFVRAAITEALRVLEAARSDFAEKADAFLQARLSELNKLEAAHERQMELDLGDLPEQIRNSRRLTAIQAIRRKFADAQNYVTNTAQTETAPYLQLVAVFAGR